MQEDSLARTLLIVSDVVAGRGDEQDQPRERTKRAGEHPRREESVPFPRIQNRTERDKDDGHGEVFD